MKTIVHSGSAEAAMCYSALNGNLEMTVYMPRRTKRGWKSFYEFMLQVSLTGFQGHVAFAGLTKCEESELRDLTAASPAHQSAASCRVTWKPRVLAHLVSKQQRFKCDANCLLRVC